METQKIFILQIRSVDTDQWNDKATYSNSKSAMNNFSITVKNLTGKEPGYSIFKSRDFNPQYTYEIRVISAIQYKNGSRLPFEVLDYINYC